MKIAGGRRLDKEANAIAAHQAHRRPGQSSTLLRCAFSSCRYARLACANF
jgi:hypothetical protein